jgi:hypothetical protein
VLVISSNDFLAPAVRAQYALPGTESLSNYSLTSTAGPPSLPILSSLNHSPAFALELASSINTASGASTSSLSVPNSTYPSRAETPTVLGTQSSFRIPTAPAPELIQQAFHQSSKAMPLPATPAVGANHWDVEDYGLGWEGDHDFEGDLLDKGSEEEDSKEWCRLAQRSRYSIIGCEGQGQDSAKGRKGGEESKG